MHSSWLIKVAFLHSNCLIKKAAVLHSYWLIKKAAALHSNWLIKLASQHSKWRIKKLRHTLASFKMTAVPLTSACSTCQREKV